MQIQLTLITAVIETLLYTSIYLGWTSLQPVLYKERFFIELCSNGTDSCNEQTEAFNLVFSLSTSIQRISSVLIGISIDKYGVWFGRTMLLILNSISFLLTAISRPGFSSWLLYISLPLQAIAGFNLLSVNIQTCNLSTKLRSRFVNIISGASNSCSVVLLLVKYLYESKVTFSTCFYFLAALSLVFHIRTFVLTPKKNVPFKIPSDYVYGYRQLPCFASNNIDHVEEETENADKDENPDEKSLKESLKEKNLWIFCFYYIIIQFVLIYILGIFNKWIETKVSVIKSDKYVNILGFLMFSSIFVSLSVGLFIDFLRCKFFYKFSNTIAFTKAIVTTQLITVLSTILMLILMCLQNTLIQYISMILLVVNISLFYGSFYTFIVYSYPSQYYGFIRGMVTTIAGLFLLLQYPLTLLLFSYLDGNFNIVFGALIALSFLALLQPIYGFIHLNQRVNRNNNQMNQIFNIDIRPVSKC